MNEIELNNTNLKKFVENLRKQDKEELKYFLGNNYKNKFITFILNNKTDTYFLSYNLQPACIGGAFKDKCGAQVWLLCTDNYDRKFLLKYLINKINLFKDKYGYLYNYIYKSNFKFLKFLKKQGFKVINTNNPNVKMFYFKRRKPCDI